MSEHPPTITLRIESWATTTTVSGSSKLHHSEWLTVTGGSSIQVRKRGKLHWHAAFKRDFVLCWRYDYKIYPDCNSRINHSVCSLETQIYCIILFLNIYKNNWNVCQRKIFVRLFHFSKNLRARSLSLCKHDEDGLWMAAAVKVFLQNELKHTPESLWVYLSCTAHTSITTLGARGEYNNQSSIITLIKCEFALPHYFFIFTLKAICKPVPHIYYMLCSTFTHRLWPSCIRYKYNGFSGSDRDQI